MNRDDVTGSKWLVQEGGTSPILAQSTVQIWIVLCLVDQNGFCLKSLTDSGSIPGLHTWCCSHHTCAVIPLFTLSLLTVYTFLQSLSQVFSRLSYICTHDYNLHKVLYIVILILLNSSGLLLVILLNVCLKVFPSWLERCPNSQLVTCSFNLLTYSFRLDVCMGGRVVWGLWWLCLWNSVDVGAYSEFQW